MAIETAYLSNKKDIISFSFGTKIIRFKGPYSLEKIDRVKEWDNGYIVVEAKFSHSDALIEDYIDLVPILENLYINAQSFLRPIKNVEVTYA